MTKANALAPGDWRGLLTSIPSFPGRLRLINLAAAAARLRGRERSVELWSSAPFHVNLVDRIQREMWLGCYEPHVTRAIGGLLRPGSVFLDVGANVGYHAYFAAGLVGPSGSVHAFEPDPDLYDRLARNLSSFSWARPEHLAIWHEAATLNFERAFLPEESGWGALTAIRDFNKGQRIPVNATSLDEWNASAKLSSLDLIKLDAEGAELHVLEGARTTLQRFRPTILLEVNAPLLLQGGSSPEKLIAELDRLNYSTFVLDTNRISPYAPIPAYHSVDCFCCDRDRTVSLFQELNRAGFCS